MSSLFEDQGDAEFESAKTKALNLLSFRARSSSDLRTRLLQSGFSDAIVARVLERMDELHLIDDVGYAENFAQSKIRQSGQGPRALRRDLGKKGIAQDTIEDVLSEYSDEEFFANAVALAEKRVASWNNSGVERRKQMTRLAGLLMRKGYSSEMSRRVMSHFFDGF